MTKKTELQLINRTEQILEDESNVIFNVPTISSQLQDSLKELSWYKPWTVRYIKMAENSSKLGTQLTGHVGREIDISDIDRIRIKEVEYPVGNHPRTLVDFQEYDNTLWLDIYPRPGAGTQSDSSGDTQLLTGTVTFTSGSPAVTGSGTAFTSELEVGSYISKSGSDNWYRVATITDDTNIVLAINCADTGADTSGATRYWFEYVYIFCEKNHYVEPTQTDFAGTINAGVAAGYAENVWQISVDALGTGVISKDILFTIAGTEGIYRTLEEATIITNEATIKFSPRLKGRATENAVVTFYCSSLTPQLEPVLCDLTASKVALNWVGDARTASKNSITAYGLANAEIDKITARITLLTTASTGHLASMKTALAANFSNATTQIGDAEDELDSAALACGAIDTAIGDYTTTTNYAVTELGLADDAAKKIDDAEERFLAIDGVAQKALEDCNLGLDKAVVNIAVIETAKAAEDIDIDTALTAVATQLGHAATDLTTDVDAVLNTVTIGGNVESTLINKAMAEISAARGYIENARALKEPNSQYGDLARRQIELAQAQIREAQNYIALENALVAENATSARTHISTGQGYIALENAVVSENALAARSYVSTAQGYIREALAYVNADAQETANYARLISSELQTVNGLLSQAGGYFQEANTSLRTSNTIMTINRWAINKYNLAIAELKKLVKPRQKIYSQPYG